MFRNHRFAIALPCFGILEILTLGAARNCLLFFGGSSSSKSSQTSEQKDNSAVGQDEFLNVTDGGIGARDEALVASGKRSSATKAEDEAIVLTGNRSSITQNTEDHSGRIDIGSDNQIEVNSIDAEVTGQAFDFATDISDDAFGFGKATVQEALDANRAISRDAFDLADEANYRSVEGVRDTASRAFDLVDEANYRSVEGVRDTTRDAFDFADEVNYRAFEGITDTMRQALDMAAISQDSANRTSQAANTALAKKSDDAPSAMAETFQRNVLIGLGIIAGSIIISRLPNS